MSLLFVWKDRGRQTCLYPLAQPTEEATTVDNVGPQFGGEVWAHTRATVKLTFRIFSIFGGQNTCSPAKHVLSCDLVPEPTTHATLNEVECSCGRARSAFFLPTGAVCRRKCTVKCVASAYFLFPNLFIFAEHAPMTPFERSPPPPSLK